jgi:hypothetical protein
MLTLVGQELEEELKMYGLYNYRNSNALMKSIRGMPLPLQGLLLEIIRNIRDGKSVGQNMCRMGVKEHSSISQRLKSVKQDIRQGV